MKRILTIVLASICGCAAFGQGTQPKGAASATIDVTNINARVSTNGDLFTHTPPSSPDQVAAFEVPRGSGKHTIFTGSLWLAARDIANQLYVAQQTYRQGSSNAGFWPGPIGNYHDATNNAKYDRVWKISKTQIDDHIQNYNNPQYSTPTDIAQWPGNGNTTLGEAAQLAPYVDVNNDGVYSPASGDYPAIKGDQALYIILNDNGNAKSPFSAPMGVEIHVMTYGFMNQANNPVYNTLFTEYRILNRGQISFTNLYAGMWVDFDLGNWNDDFVGSDTITNRFFAYNGDNDDDGPTGYGLTPPVQSVIFLDKKMSHFLYYNGNNNPVNGNPSQAVHFSNFLSGLWKNGQPLTFGGDGTNQNTLPFPYMFPGGATGWSETNNNLMGGINTPGDRRGLGSIGPFNLSSGQELKFTVAFNFVPGSATTSSFAQAPTDAQTVQDFFNATILSTGKAIEKASVLQLLPNPASETLTIQLADAFKNKPGSVSITDNVGREVLNLTLSSETCRAINVAHLLKGIYTVSVKSGNSMSTSKLVKL